MDGLSVFKGNDSERTVLCFCHEPPTGHSVRPAAGACSHDAPGLSMLLHGQGLNASWPAGQPLPNAAAVAASRRGA